MRIRLAPSIGFGVWMNAAMAGRNTMGKENMTFHPPLRESYGQTKPWNIDGSANLPMRAPPISGLLN